MATPEERATRRVHEFGRAWERRDIASILAMLHPEVVYQNVPGPAMRGRDEVRAFITPSLTILKRMTWEFLATVATADGRKVLTERVDTFLFPEGTVVAPLMGIFELEDDLIRGWRDYTDLGDFVRQMIAIGRVPNPALVARSDPPAAG